MDQRAQTIEAHYHRAALGGQLLDALAAAGKNTDALTTEDLAPIDEFHIRGRDASLELARLAAFGPGSHVLDVGCGIGGPSRLLAQTCGCRVTGLDLTESFCTVASMLAQRTGLHGQVSYRQGNALNMPFADATFDGVWMQHVTMNIEDKARLFAECRRVTLPAGRLALYEIVRAAEGPLHFPVPWAREAQISFVAPEVEMRQALESAGFVIEHWEDLTEPGAEWFRRMLARVRESGPPALGLHVLVGPEMGVMAANVLRNIEEGRIRIVRGVARSAT